MGKKFDPIEGLFYSVIDPKSKIKDCPAITTLMKSVCNDDIDKFDEACRLIRLYMEAAYNAGR